MRTLDARLRHLVRRTRGRAAVADSLFAGSLFAERVGWLPGPGNGAVDVLLSCTDDRWLGDLPGLAERVAPATAARPDASGGGPWQDGGLYTARVPVNALERLAGHDSVLRIESSRPLFPELNVSRPEVRAPAPGGGPGAGEGAVVAIIDSGVDYTHPAFRDAVGGSRILCLWDQNAPGAPEASTPYGREYRKEDLDKALDAADPAAVVPHADDELGHGTHVAGIAAGDDSRLGGEYTGIAPRAGLIVVALSGEPGVTLGRSTQLVDAAAYAVRRAEGLPVAVNLSQGMNGGGHGGESLVERALDALAARPGVAIVKSAGNEQEWNIHAGGTLAEGATAELELLVRPGDVEDDVIEIWFGGEDTISVGVAPPSGPRSPFTPPGEERLFTTAAGDRVTIDSETDCSGSGDTAVTVILSRGRGAGVEPGTWRLLLRGDAVPRGRYDAWIERAPRGGDGAPEQTTFSAASADPTRTISVPGTARRVITVGSYATRPASWWTGLGELSSFSSRGPSRTGARKPDLAAPGEWIASARCAGSAQPPRPDAAHTLMAGTSMAAPHVCGAAAVVLAARAAAGLPPLSGEQVGQLLRDTARPAGSGPDDAWGAGRLDVSAAVEAAAVAAFPQVLNVRADGGRLSWETDVPCSWELRCHTDAGRLSIGQALRTLGDPAPAREHAADLTGLPAGDYVCEILVTAPSGLWTRDDNAGGGHPVRVPGPARPAEPAVEAGGDDLRRVKGVGPVIARLLAEHGITTFRQLAGTPPDELAVVLQPAGMSGERLARMGLAERAALLAAEEDAAREAAGTGGAGGATLERHSFTLTVTADTATGLAVGCEIRHHGTDDAQRLRSWDVGALEAFIEERGGLRLSGGGPADDAGPPAQG
ncbi:S8 family serine peptidase [Actinomadura sp. ATCC 31491]|uniref:S8 family serine peptidase n=1 Tax=Actinomadura luzonensis TaxID=2805427 RepID=A0ABT0G3X4_9ACTN|nr:S8 family serine peptidase [Actinomadura luzonensis]MCK2219290.1 S8 family serine peptidase [Actinomadura luzonensis]